MTVICEGRYQDVHFVWVSLKRDCDGFFIQIFPLFEWRWALEWREKPVRENGKCLVIRNISFICYSLIKCMHLLSEYLPVSPVCDPAGILPWYPAVCGRLHPLGKPMRSSCGVKIKVERPSIHEGVMEDRLQVAFKPLNGHVVQVTR